MKKNLLWLILGLILGLLITSINSIKGTRNQQHPTESYQIVIYDTPTKEWVIIAVNKENNTHVQITAVCDFYRWGDREPLRNPDGCDIMVGEVLFPNRLGLYQGEFLDVWQQGDTLFITKGEGEKRIHQQFSIKSKKLL